MRARVRLIGMAVCAVMTTFSLVMALTTPLYAGPLPAAPSAGTASQTVRQAQYILISHGYTGIGPADNVLGPRTRRGLRQWQEANGLAPTGQPDAATMASLFDSTVTVTVTAPAKRLTPPVVVPLGQPEDVESIIRDVWSGEPARVQDEAVRIAKRESSLVPTARNACCYGLFQIHFKAHRAWLPDYGVNQPSDLFDPRTNATVALALYTAEHGWSPAWNL